MFGLSKNLPVPKESAAPIGGDELEKLFARAMEYGKIYLYQHDDGTFSFKITFRTPGGISLVAASGYNNTAIVPAIKECLENAKKIMESVR